MEASAEDRTEKEESKPGFPREEVDGFELRVRGGETARD